MKKVLITGKNSYIGTSFMKYMSKQSEDYKIDSISLRDEKWKNISFAKYDVIVHTAALVHKKNKKRYDYFKINRDLAVDVAKKAKCENVKQFIFLSSMSVYGIDEGVIDQKTRPNPKTYYAKSKYEAEKQLLNMLDDNFSVSILRIPMVYGYKCKGNYVRLSKLVNKIGIFPDMNNYRSMIYIDNLSGVIKNIVDEKVNGILYPQNNRYVNIKDLAGEIRRVKGKSIRYTKKFNWLIKLMMKVSKTFRKVFGTCIYDKSLYESVDGKKIEDKVDDFKKTILYTECSSKGKNIKLALVSEFFYPCQTSTPKIITELAEDLSANGIDVKVITSKKIYNQKKAKLKKSECYKGISVRRIWCTNFNKNHSLGKIINYLSFIISSFIFLLFKNDYDKLLLVSNPPLSGIIGSLIKKVKNKEYIYLVHDIYPNIAEKLNIIKANSIISKIMKNINKIIYKNAKKVIVLGEDMKSILIKDGVNREKIKVITNWADKKKIYLIDKKNCFSINNNLAESFNLMYTGNIGRFHDIETIINCAVKIKDRRDIKFIFVGEGYKKDYVIKSKAKYSLDNVVLFSYQDEEIYNEVLNSADVFLCSLSSGAEGLAVPSKTYSYYAAGKPVFAIMNENSEIAREISDFGLGKVIKPGDSDSLKKYIIQAEEEKYEYEKIVENIKDTFSKRYERKVITKIFFDYLISS